MTVIPHGHSVLLHCLQQCRLRLWRGTVDLVCQDQVCKNGSALEGKRAALLVLDDDIRSCHIAWHQIRRKLDPLERQVKNLADRADQSRLSQSRHTLQQHIAPCEHGEHDLAYDLPLPDDPLLNLLLAGSDPLRHVRRILQPAIHPFTHNHNSSLTFI